MPLEVIFQPIVESKHIPTHEQLQLWAETALTQAKIPTSFPYQLTVRLVDKEESAYLNENFRKKKGPTNILSFNYSESLFPTDENEPVYLGDLVVCTDLVTEEAIEQKKEEQAHWAHLIVHGVLHLCGYDHEKETDAEQMESLEIKILKQLNYENPYQEHSL